MACNLFIGLLLLSTSYHFAIVSVGFYIIQLFPMIVIIAITGLELAIAFLQAYVWTTLVCLYLSDAINLH